MKKGMEFKYDYDTDWGAAICIRLSLRNNTISLAIVRVVNLNFGLCKLACRVTNEPTTSLDSKPHSQSIFIDNFFEYCNL